MFLKLASELNIPINVKKTVLPTTSPTVHGIEFDTQLMQIRLPEEKLTKIRHQLKTIVSQKSVSLQNLQSIIGLLNFACLVVSPGRAFLRRVIDLTKGHVKPFHHIHINKEACQDFKAWKHFLDNFNGISVLKKATWESSIKCQLFTDSAKSTGCAAVFNNLWFSLPWESNVQHYHISLLELYPIIIALYIWGSSLQNKCILFMCDNAAVVDIINNQTCKDSNTMVLVRHLVITCLKYNINFRAKHIPGKNNIIADLLSRLQIPEALKLNDQLSHRGTHIPQHLELSRLLLSKF
jgi:hypothetical protein